MSKSSGPLAWIKSVGRESAPKPADPSMTRQGRIFRYQRYLEQIVRDPNTRAETRAAAIDELKQREDLQQTSKWLIGLAFGAAAVTGVGQLCLRDYHLLAIFSGRPATQPTNEAPSAVGVALAAILWCFAWYFSGSLVGFLFGIPRTLQAAQAAPKDKADAIGGQPGYRQQVNTNLEQISDWLTKIIVGIGLIQLRRLPAYIVGISQFMAEHDCGIGCPPFAAAVLITFSILGFLTGYLLTRMYLASAFLRADLAGAGAPSPAQDQILGYRFDPARATQGTVLVDAKTLNAAIETVSSPTTDDETFKDRWARAKALTIKGRYAEAAAAYANLTQEQPDNPILRLEYAWVLFKRDSGWSKELQEQLDKAYQLAPPPGSEERKQLFESLTFYPLYRDPDGFTDASKYGEEYVRDHRNLPSAEMWMNLACAYGQQAKATSDPNQLSTIREKALEAVRNAVKLDPNTVQTLREQLLGQPPENDLAAFSNDPEFRQALALPRSA